MNTTFSKNFIVKLLLGTIISILFVLLFSIIFQNTKNNHYSVEIFKPIDKINLLSRISSDSSKYAFQSNVEFSPDLKIESSFFLKHKSIRNRLENLRCSRRQKALIFENLYFKDLKLKDSKYSYENFLISTIDKYFTKTSINCNHFLQYMKILENLALLGVDVKPIRVKSTIESYLTEHTSWDWKSPCVYFKKEGKDLVYLSGAIINCLFNKKNIKSFSDVKLVSEISTLANVIHRQLSGIKNKNFKNLNKPENFFITLNPRIQGWLNLYKKCFDFSEFCNLTSTSNLSKMNNVSIVVLNSDNSEVLGSICIGKKCTDSGLNVYKDLASMHVKSPPASISKLLYALSFANSSTIEKKMLLRQIKTSGQIDSKLGRRNEWWEKNAICDGRELTECKHLKNVTRYADLFGIATDCSMVQKEEIYPKSNLLLNSLDCGKISLIKSNHFSDYSYVNNSVEGFVGYLPLADKLFYRSNKIINFLKWNDYENFRKKTYLFSKKKEYLNTSHVVQSVIGGGESRISALGIASILSQINQMANKQNLQLPSLVKVVNERAGIKRPNLLKSDISSAGYVISGLQKAILAKEIGWKGNGTAYKSFKKVFGRDCLPDCPVVGKTGTVSFKDKNFIGTTLFSGLVDTKKMMRYLNLNVKSKTPNLAIGVIVFSEKDNSEGHYAAQIFMSLVKDIMQRNNLYEFKNKKKALVEEKYYFRYGIQ